ncbi:MAG: flagellar motor protein MotB [Desulfobulbaceae bacterium]|nr:flagellar motor protein MotB [Desulfobulbaceae bacterium]
MDTSNLNNHTEISQDNIAKPSVSPIRQGKLRSAANYIYIERRTEDHAVFRVDDSSFTPTLPRATHWSIAWSDLMMTMFILFLTMFVYQAANEEFLGEKQPEILGGDTTEALESMDASDAAFPFAPIHPGLPLITAGTIKKVERVHDVMSLKSDPVKEGRVEPTTEIQMEADSETADSERISREPIALILPQNNRALPAPKDSTPLQSPEEILEPLPLDSTEPELSQYTDFQEIFVLSKNALDDNNLNKFAAIDIIPDKTVRIILTSDLLFALGKSELSSKAKNSLRKIAQVIRLTPYMINVVGHTDNIPMQSYKFKSNWELSVARATAVTRFFINEIRMDPIQFVVSGYASYRPIKPNTTAENRAKNRRVEIIISKRLPSPISPTTNNL